MAHRTKEDRNKYNRIWYHRNRERVLEQRNRWARGNPERRAEITRAYCLKRKYGLTPTEWEERFEAQGRACKICTATEPRGGRWAVDHCHRTNTVRGILCMQCNVAIGGLLDDPSLLVKAAAYLRGWGA